MHQERAQNEYWYHCSESVLYCLLKASGRAPRHGSAVVGSEEFLDFLLCDKQTAKWFLDLGMDNNRRSILAAARQTLSTKVLSNPAKAPRGKINLSENLERIMDLARADVGRRRYFWIEPEHVLLAILKDNNSTAARLLCADKAFVKKLVPHLEDRCQAMSNSSVNVSVAVLRFAGWQAEQAGCDAVYPQHILAGLILLGSGFTDETLLDKVTVEKIRSHHWSANSNGRLAEPTRKQPQKDSHAPGQRLSRSKEVAAIFNQAFKFQRHSAMPNLTAKHITQALLACSTAEELRRFLSAAGVDLDALASAVES